MANLRTSLIMELKDRISGPARRITRTFGRFSRDARLQQLRRSFRRVGERFADVRRQAGALARRFTIMAAAAGAAAAAAFGLVRGTARMGDELSKTSRKIGVSVRELGGYRFAFEKLAGVTQQTTDMALQRFVRRTAEAANGTGEAEAALKFLNIQLRDSEGRLRGPAQLLPEVADALANVEDQSLRVRIAFKLFDSEGVALVNGLQQGSDALREQLALYEKFGPLTEEGAKRSEEFTDEQTNLFTALKLVKDAVAVELMPALTDWMKRMRELITANREVIVRETVRRIKEFTQGVRDFGAAVKSVVDRVGGWRNALLLVGGFISIKLTVAVLSLGLAVIDLGRRMKIATGIAWLFNAALTANPIGLVVTAIGALIGTIALLRSEWFRASETWLKISNAIGGSIESIQIWFDELRKKAVSVFEAITGVVPDWLKDLLGGAVNLGGSIAGRVRDLFSSAPGAGADRAGGQAAPLSLRGGRTEVGGLLRIQIDSEGRPRVRQMERRGPVDIDVDAGPLMVGSG